VLHLKPIALAVSELFTAVRKFKILKVFDPFDLVLYLWIVLYLGNVHAKYEVRNYSHSGNIDTILKFKSRLR